MRNLSHICAVVLALGYLTCAESRADEEDIPAAASHISSRQVLLGFTLIQIPEKFYEANQKKLEAMAKAGDTGSLISLLHDAPGATILPTPRVSTQDGLRADINDLHSVTYATAFGKDGKPLREGTRTMDLGYTIQALPVITPDSKTIDVKFYFHRLTLVRGVEDERHFVKQPAFYATSLRSMALVSDKHDMGLWPYVDPNQPPPASRTLLVIQAQIVSPAAAPHK